MADYCALSDALALLGGLTLRDASAGPPAVAATEPSLTQAGAMLTQTCAEIDMHLRGLGYALPVTDAEALASLSAMAMNGAAARIAKARWPNAAGPGGDGGVAIMLREDYQRGLDFIDRGGLALDVPSESASASVAYDFDRDYNVQGSAYNDDEYEAPF